MKGAIGAPKIRTEGALKCAFRAFLREECRAGKVWVSFGQERIQSKLTGIDLRHRGGDVEINRFSRRSRDVSESVGSTMELVL